MIETTLHNMVRRTIGLFQKGGGMWHRYSSSTDKPAGYHECAHQFIGQQRIESVLPNVVPKSAIPLPALPFIDICFCNPMVPEPDAYAGVKYKPSYYAAASL